MVVVLVLVLLVLLVLVCLFSPLPPPLRAGHGVETPDAAVPQAASDHPCQARRQEAVRFAQLETHTHTHTLTLLHSLLHSLTLSLTLSLSHSLTHCFCCMHSELMTLKWTVSCDWEQSQAEQAMENTDPQSCKCLSSNNSGMLSLVAC